MKFGQTTLVFALSAMSAFAQAQQSPSILGKTDLHALLEAAPGVPNTPAEAAKRAQQKRRPGPSPTRTRSWPEWVASANSSR